MKTKELEELAAKATDIHESMIAAMSLVGAGVPRGLERDTLSMAMEQLESYHETIKKLTVSLSIMTLVADVRKDIAIDKPKDLGPWDIT